MIKSSPTKIKQNPLLHRLLSKHRRAILYPEVVTKLWRKPLDYKEKATAPAQLHIDKERCKGCGFCVDFCPRGVIKMTSELSPKGYTLAAVDDEDKCLACGFCEAICPEFAIKVSTTNNQTNSS